MKIEHGISCAFWSMAMLVSGCGVNMGGESSPTGGSADRGVKEVHREAASGRRVRFNGDPVTESQMAELERIERQFGFRLPDGEFWYDEGCGAIGLWGGPTAGFLPAGLRIAGPMPADCSTGGTEVFVNGRELHPIDVQGLQRIVGTVWPRRYLLDGMGNVALENGAYLGNLVQAAQSANAGGRNGWTRRVEGVSSGDTGYLANMGDGTFYFSDNKGNTWPR